MTFFAVQVGNSFGYFKSFKDAKDIYKQKGFVESASIRKVSVNGYTKVFSDIGDDIGHLSLEEYNEPNDKQPGRLYTIGVPGTTMKFHRSERAAAFYNDNRLGMTEEICVWFMKTSEDQHGGPINVSWKNVYGLSYIYDKCATGDSRPLEEIFDDMKQRGDMYQIRLGEFGILRPMGYEHDTIDETHRLIYKMGRSYSELYDLIGDQ